MEREGEREEGGRERGREMKEGGYNAVGICSQFPQMIGRLVIATNEYR